MPKKREISLFQSLIESISDMFEENENTTTGSNKCQYWNCNKSIRSGYFLCYEHYEDLKDGLIDKCPGCGRYKDEEYELCLDCRKKKSAAGKSKTQKYTKSRYRIEHSDNWRNQNKGDSQFYVYILKFTDGKFYVGHTDNLRVRLSEHRDGKTKSTANKKFSVQYFETLDTRKKAELREVELKGLADKDERKLRKEILEFKDNHSELFR